MVLFLGEAIPIYAEIENCSSRLVVPKAAIFQTQTYLASGRTKTIRHMVANVRGNHIASGGTDTWNGKTLKIPPVTPSILDCCIIRVDYSLAVSRDLLKMKNMYNGAAAGPCCHEYVHLTPGTVFLYVSLRADRGLMGIGLCSQSKTVPLSNLIK